jgi:hypothetical protein
MRGFLLFMARLQRHVRRMPKVFILRVTTNVMVGEEPAIMLWAVETTSSDKALEAVEKQVPTNWAVELSDYELTPAAIKRLKLVPDQPRSLT